MTVVYESRTSLTELMKRTTALHLTALPGKGHQGQDEIRIVGENFNRTVRSHLQWDRVLNNLERPGQKAVSSADWGKEENEFTGRLVCASKVPNWG